MNPQLVIFAIESAVKLGRTIYEVLVAETADRALVLPVGHLFPDVEINVGADVFLRPEDRHFVEAGGPYENVAPEEQLASYRTLLDLNRRLGSASGDFTEAAEIIANLNAFEQV